MGNLGPYRLVRFFSRCKLFEHLVDLSSGGLDRDPTEEVVIYEPHPKMLVVGSPILEFILDSYLLAEEKSKWLEPLSWGEAVLCQILFGLGGRGDEDRWHELVLDEALELQDFKIVVHGYY